jgi:hypothetical protein
MIREKVAVAEDKDREKRYNKTRRGYKKLYPMKKNYIDNKNINHNNPVSQ